MLVCSIKEPNSRNSFHFLHTCNRFHDNLILMRACVCLYPTRFPRVKKNHTQHPTKNHQGAFTRVLFRSNRWFGARDTRTAPIETHFSWGNRYRITVSGKVLHWGLLVGSKLCKTPPFCLVIRHLFYHQNIRAHANTIKCNGVLLSIAR